MISVPPNVNVPLVVIGPPLTDKPVVPPEPWTDVTVPPPTAEVSCDIVTYFTILSVISDITTLSEDATVTDVPLLASFMKLSAPA